MARRAQQGRVDAGRHHQHDPHSSCRLPQRRPPHVHGTDRTRASCQVQDSSADRPARRRAVRRVPGKDGAVLLPDFYHRPSAEQDDGRRLGRLPRPFGSTRGGVSRAWRTVTLAGPATAVLASETSSGDPTRTRGAADRQSGFVGGTFGSPTFLAIPASSCPRAHARARRGPVSVHNVGRVFPCGGLDLSPHRSRHRQRPYRLFEPSCGSRSRASAISGRSCRYRKQRLRLCAYLGVA